MSITQQRSDDGVNFADSQWMPHLGRDHIGNVGTFEVGSRGRIFTDSVFREELDVDDPKGTTISVLISSESYAETGVSYASFFDTELLRDGEFTIPTEVRDTLSIGVGDDVEVWVVRPQEF